MTTNRKTLLQMSRVKKSGVVVKQHDGGWLVSVVDLYPDARTALAQLGLALYAPKKAPPLYIPADHPECPGRRVPRSSLYENQLYVTGDTVRFYPAKGVYEQIRFFFTDSGEFCQPRLYTNDRGMHPVNFVNRDAPLKEFYAWCKALNKRIAIHCAIESGGTITPHMLGSRMGGHVRLSIAAEQLFNQGLSVADAFGEIVDRSLLNGPEQSYNIRMLSLASTHFYVHPNHLVTRDGL